jgi:uncharacterized repeat protein (TIGR01451 family)
MLRWFALLVLILVAASLSGGAGPQRVRAVTFSPATSDELIAAISDANGNGAEDLIELVPGATYMLTGAADTVEGANGLPAILPDGGRRITINGNGAIIERNATALFRILHVAHGANLVLNDVVIRGGIMPGAPGGGILNRGTLAVNGGAIRNNAGTGLVSLASGPGSQASLILVGTIVTANGDGGVSIAGLDGGTATATITDALLTRNVAYNLSASAEGTASATVSVQRSTVSESGGLGVFLMARVSGNVDVEISRSTLSGNITAGISLAASFGGDIDAHLINTTVSGNGDEGILVSSGDSGMAIARAVNSTIADNASNGIAIVEHPGSTAAADITNTIVAGSGGANCLVTEGGVLNAAASLADDASCSAFALAAVDSLHLLPLADNGGPTLTHALAPGSPAIDAGRDAACENNNLGGSDQRGLARIADGDLDGEARCDVGAFEVSPAITFTKTGPATAAPGEEIVYTITLANAGELAGSITVEDVLPDGLSFVALGVVVAEGPLPVLAEPCEEGQTVACAIAHLGAGDSVTLTLTTAVDAGLADGHVIENTATLAGGTVATEAVTTTVVADTGAPPAEPTAVAGDIATPEPSPAPDAEIAPPTGGHGSFRVFAPMAARE